MYSSESSIGITKDFSYKYVQNLVNKLSNIKSNAYFITLDKKVSAKSIVGILSAGIRYGNIVRVYVFNEISQEIANEDLEYILSIIKD